MTVNVVAGVVPKCTASASANPLPVTVTTVPPAGGPESGLSALTAGTGGIGTAYGPEATGGRSELVDTDRVEEVVGELVTLPRVTVRWSPGLTGAETLMLSVAPVELLLPTSMPAVSSCTLPEPSTVPAGEATVTKPPLVGLSAPVEDTWKFTRYWAATAPGAVIDTHVLTAETDWAGVMV
jgi:hypothetical protein